MLPIHMIRQLRQLLQHLPPPLLPTMIMHRHQPLPHQLQHPHQPLPHQHRLL
jgi:hypothetical protein